MPDLFGLVLTGQGQPTQDLGLSVWDTTRLDVLCAAGWLVILLVGMLAVWGARRLRARAPLPPACLPVQG